MQISPVSNSQSFAPSLALSGWFRAFFHKDPKALSEIDVESFDLDPRELIAYAQRTIDALTELAPEHAYQGAVILRKIYYRSITKAEKPLMCPPISFVKALEFFKKQPPIHFELLVLKEILEGQEPLLLSRIIMLHKNEPSITQKTKDMSQQLLTEQNNILALKDTIMTDIQNSRKRKWEAYKKENLPKDPEMRLKTILRNHFDQASYECTQREIKKLHDNPRYFLSICNPQEKEVESILDAISNDLSTAKHNDDELAEKFDDICCPITREVMKEPVTAQDGHSYEKNAIVEHLKKSNLSPLTGLPMGTQLTPNLTLKKLIATLKDQRKRDQDQRAEPAAPPSEMEIRTFYNPKRVKWASDIEENNLSRAEPAIPPSRMEMENLNRAEPAIPFSEKKKSLTLRQMHLLELILDPSASTYTSLGMTLPPGDTIILPDRTKVTKQQLFLMAIDLDPKFAMAYLQLGDTLPPGGSILLCSGTIMTKEALSKKFKELQSQNEKKPTGS